MNRLLHGALAALLLGLMILWSIDPARVAADGKDKKKKSETATETVDEPDAIGAWPQYKIGQKERILVWYQNDQWNVRTTTPANHKVVFTGIIHFHDGKLQALGVDKLESKGKKPGDVGNWIPERNQFEFKLTTNGNEDYFNFKPSAKTTKLDFILKIEGADHPEFIFIGSKGQHPKSSTFTLPAFPMAK